MRNLVWPDGCSFAFTIFDDTDLATLENVAPVYAFLEEKGFRTTKSVWPLQGTLRPFIGGETCESPRYLAWVQGLQAQGFEIGYHLATYHTSTREQSRAGLTRFFEYFGHDPKTMANHAGCDEGIYWGAARLGGINRIIYNILTKGKNRRNFRGHWEGDPLFWGDLCRERVRYVRNFVVGDINTLKACPYMPYHDPARPYVNKWFASSEGAEVDYFTKTISEDNQDRLEAEGGACIMYAHLAKGFYRDGQLDPRFTLLMNRLAGKKGWFVPVATLLDYLANYRGEQVLTARKRLILEIRWLFHKIFLGGTT